MMKTRTMMMTRRIDFSPHIARPDFHAILAPSFSDRGRLRRVIDDNGVNLRRERGRGARGRGNMGRVAFANLGAPGRRRR